MNIEPEKSLERFISDELKRTPNFKAPAGFAERVMQQATSPAEMWWQASWINWPLGAKLLSIILFAALAWASLHEFATLIMGLNLQPLTLQATRLAQNGLTVAGSVWSWLKPFQNQWLFWSLLAFGMTTSFAIGAGRALWPLLQRKD